MIAKQITPGSFILTSSVTGKKIGIATKKETGYSLLQEPTIIFETLDHIAKYFNEDIDDGTDKKNIEPVVSVICGYPIKHEEVHELTSDEESNLHTYKSKDGGKIVHVAGYFGVKFKNGFVKKFCPRIETLLENDYIGPFKDKFELQFQISKHNRE